MRSKKGQKNNKKKIRGNEGFKKQTISMRSKVRNAESFQGFFCEVIATQGSQVSLFRSTKK